MTLSIGAPAINAPAIEAGLAAHFDLPVIAQCAAARWFGLMAVPAFACCGQPGG